MPRAGAAVGSANLNAEVRHSFYAAGTLPFGSTGLRAEYKNDSDFDLLFNDPPPAIRENAEVLQNRVTHTLENANERGYQLEFFAALGPALHLVINRSLARNAFDFGLRRLFQERYLSLAYAGSPWSIEGFC